MYAIDEGALKKMVATILWIIENDSHIPSEKIDELIESYNYKAGDIDE